MNWTHYERAFVTALIVVLVVSACGICYNQGFEDGWYACEAEETGEPLDQSLRQYSLGEDDAGQIGGPDFAVRPTVRVHADH